MSRLIRKLSYANVMSTIALFAALSGTAWAAATIGASDIRKNAIRTAHIKNGQIQRADLRNALVNTPKLANGAVRANKIANGAVNRNKVANNAVNSAKIANGSVAAVDLADGSVGPDSLAVVPTVAARITANQTIGTGGRKVMFASELVDTAGMHSTTTATDRFVVQRDGVYVITGNVRWQLFAAAAGIFASIEVGNAGSAVTSPFAVQSGVANGTSSVSQSVSATLPLEAGQYVVLTADQFTGNNQVINAANIGMTWVSPLP